VKIMRRLRHCFFLAAAALVSAVALLSATAAGWLERVDPLITPSEKKAYLALRPEARSDFEQNFWAGKAISGDEYFRRAEYIDSAFGSGKAGSGANTDQGRVWLSLGRPSRVTRIPSSRIFVPLEIWYYDTVPGVIDTEIRLVFFRKNSVGLFNLYSPQTDTIRALLLPQADTRSMFGPNDSTSESDIRKQLTVGPAEDEVVSAAVNVATGVHDSGNQEILGRVSSPMAMLGKPLKTEVISRLIVNHVKIDSLTTASPFGGSQIDVQVGTTAQKEIGIELTAGGVTVYQSVLRLRFSAPEAINYLHRLDLLPGSYTMLLTVDGKVSSSPLDVLAKPVLSEIHRGDWSESAEGRTTPFEFDARQLVLNPEGKFAVLSLAAPGKVTWMIRHGSEVVWRSASEGRDLASVKLPVKGIPPGSYRLEAVTANDSRTISFNVSSESGVAASAPVVSFNANLAPARRYAFVGHQWLLRGQTEKARNSLQASLRNGVTEDAQIELARADALSGNLDEARERVRAVLVAHPASFDGLSVYAFIEAQFQDYAAAADLYRRALAVQDSPALRVALAKLPVQLTQSQ
jgi:GWxTD domain-containing protein